MFDLVELYGKIPSFQPLIANQTIRDMVFLFHFAQIWNVIRAVDRNVPQWWFCSWSLAMLFLHFNQNVCHDRYVIQSHSYTIDRPELAYQTALYRTDSVRPGLWPLCDPSG